MLALLVTAARAQEAAAEVEPRTGEFSPEGYVLEPVAGGSGVHLATGSVVGGDGATTAVTLRGRIRLGDAALVVGVPFATWRTADGRDAGLGNLSVGGWLPAGERGALGVVGHVPLGGRAWTWVNEVEELWPGVGLDVVYRGDQPVSDRVSFLGRVSGGVHTSGGYEPVPGLYAKVGAAGGLDVAVHDRVGLVAEGSFAWWDTSPLDVAALVRADTQGFRVRGGLLLPLASWTGAQPAPVPAGIREATLRLDLAAQW
jgi:hypothetical protein